jgi:hypothetical protein
MVCHLEDTRELDGLAETEASKGTILGINMVCRKARPAPLVVVPQPTLGCGNCLNIEKASREFVRHYAALEVLYTQQC